MKEHISHFLFDIIFKSTLEPSLIEISPKMTSTKTRRTAVERKEISLFSALFVAINCDSMMPEVIFYSFGEWMNIKWRAWALCQHSLTATAFVIIPIVNSSHFHMYCYNTFYLNFNSFSFKIVFSLDTFFLAFRFDFLFGIFKAHLVNSVRDIAQSLWHTHIQIHRQRRQRTKRQSQWQIEKSQHQQHQRKNNFLGTMTRRNGGGVRRSVCSVKLRHWFNLYSIKNSVNDFFWMNNFM